MPNAWIMTFNYESKMHKDTVRRAIQDVSWRRVIRGRVLIVGDMNAHSSMWNPHCRQKANAGPLEELIKSYKLIVNNNTNFPTLPSSPGISIIDLALTSPELGLLRVWEIPAEYPSLSDHELILIEWEDIETQEPETQQAAMSGWSIKNLLEDKELLQAAKDEWNMTSKGQAYLSLSCTKEDLDREVEWFESRLTEFLNSHAKITRITVYSKRWWNEEVAEARKAWAKDKKRLGRNEDLKEELKQARNSYYRTIRKAKRTCWQEFLQGQSQKSQSSSSIIDKNHCWTAFF